ncbi:hypothetical protein GCM10010218_37380 [Streptomyces mashuensis]|uniref:ATP-grasp domain-containing protein n=1 Tax=Streptomyces mashuensis TaxID=33904 RepID=A0A919B5H0_9ACTN|nr:hypothetical protein [Streptomyces mashuensis]GHF52441.1 hypothetical protein GCM10010218_37380 [Streptomyces mashuensis]
MARRIASPPHPGDLRVLYLGRQQEAVDALTRLGAAVTCVMQPTEREKALREGFGGALAVAGDHTCVEDVLGALADLGLAPEDFSLVCTEDEFAIVTAAVLDGRDGPAVAAALALRDKGLQKRLVRAAGIPTADWARFPDLTAVAGAVERGALRFPFVVKPPAGAGAQHTWVVAGREGPDGLDALLRRPGTPAGPWLAEAFVPGEELHVDGVVRDGRVLLASVSRYLHNVVDVHRGRLVASATLDDDAERDLIRAATDLTERSLAALGRTDGVFHLEAFHRDGVLTFGECAGRIGGGLILEAVRRKHGIDLYHEWAAAVLGRPSSVTGGGPGPVKDSFGWVNLAAPPGRIRELPSREALEARPGVVEGQLWAAPGEVVGDLSQGSHLLVAKALVQAPSEAAARSQLLDVAAWFGEELRVDPLDGTA